MDFSIMFWGDVSRTENTQEAYRNILAITRYADENGYVAVWLPERHFHPWGGLHPNPSVLAATMAPMTKRLRLRAGSVVLPLHHPVRVVEEWSVVDNLSGGRVELAIASGWKDDDFVLAPKMYARRREEVWTSLDTVRRLWRGERLSAENGSGRRVEVPVYPRPVQAELPVWITSAGALRTVADAGGAGLNLLIHLLAQDYRDVEQKVAQYKAYRVRNGFKTPGKVALMLHTFLGPDRDQVRATVKDALSAYLLNSADLAVPSESREQWANTEQGVRGEMADVAFDRYFETASLMGTPSSCQATVRRVRALGISEICCLVDFGLDLKVVLDGLNYLTELKGSVQ
jgi:natural product biosynthesis luciferase-like monooxygenase protein